MAVAAIGLNLAAANVMASVEHVCRDLIERGTAHRLGKRLRKELNKLIPENCAEIVDRRPGKVTVTYTHVCTETELSVSASFLNLVELPHFLVDRKNVPVTI